MTGRFNNITPLKLEDHFLSVDRQLKAWRKANRKMKWGIFELEFHQLPAPPELTPDDLSDGFESVMLSYRTWKK